MNGLMVSLVTGLLGLAFFNYGRKQERAPQLIGGIALMVYPYFITGLGATIAVGTAILGAILLATNAGY